MPQSPPADTMHAGRRFHTMLPALALSLAAFLTQLDVTALVVAMPALAAALDLGVAGYAWVMDAYSLAFAGSLPAAGALADRYGRRRAVLLGNAFFALASGACAAAWDGPTLCAARALQGVGAAFAVTGAIALTANVYPEPEQRARAFACFGVTSGIAMALGPTIGGAIASWLGWHWIFLMNLPVCALVAWSVPRLVGEAREAVPRPLDLLGVALLTSALGTAIVAFLHGRSSGVHLIVGLALSVLLFAAFVRQQARRQQPVLDPTVFAQPVMIGIAVLLLAVSVAFWAVLFYLPLYLAAAFGWSANVAGTALLAATMPMLVLPPAAGRLVLRWGWRRHFAVGLAAIAAGNVALAATSLETNAAIQLPVVVAGMLGIGIGAALVHPQLSGAAVALVPPDQAGMASAVTVVIRQGGFAIGIAALGATLQSEGTEISYLGLFAATSLASLCGLIAALRFLPHRR
jgi:EmrB/QacA subfamily drug resistance transporter